MAGLTEAPEGQSKVTITGHIRAHPYHMYILGIITFVYLLNQLDRYLYGVVLIPFIDYKGYEYGLISGPLFTVIYTVAGVVISYFGGAKAKHRKLFLASALIVWSIATGLTGFATRFWHVALTRVLQGLGEAGCTPFATSIIADFFPRQVLGTAISFYNVGIYTGYSIALSLGTVLSGAFGEGVWQPSYFLFAGIGIFVAALLYGTVKVKPPPAQRLSVASVSHTPRGAVLSVRELARYWLSSPSLLLLCLAGGIRNAGGYVWGSYTRVFFKDFRHVPNDVFAAYMGWIPLVGGSLGALAGGFISDKLVNRVGSDGRKLGPRARLLVIMLSNLAASPFCLGALALPAPLHANSAPWAFLCLIPSNVIGEMWIGVTLTLVIESVPSHLKTTSVALYLFIITNIGGNAPLLVPVLQKAGLSLQGALIVMFPGVYILSAFFFLVVIIFVGRDMRRAREQESAEARKGLLEEAARGDGDADGAYEADPEAGSGYPTRDSSERTKSLETSSK